MTLYLPWMTLKWFISPASSSQTVWTQTVDQEDGIQCSQRQVDKKRQEETRTFKGPATGKGLWVGLCSLSGLAASLWASRSKTPQEEISGRSVSVTVDTHAAWVGGLALCWELWNNETVLSSCMLVWHSDQQLTATVWGNTLIFLGESQMRRLILIDFHVCLLNITSSWLA